MRKIKIEKPLISKEVFVQSLEGCITDKNQVEKLDPLELKKIWSPLPTHD